MPLDRAGRNDLMYAVTHNDEAQIDALLSSDIDVNHQDKQGWTALHFAAQNNDAAIAQKLLEHGADICKRDSYGNTPLGRAVSSYRGEAECITTLLNAGANPDERNNHGVSPRELAEKIANYDTAKFFVQS